MKTSLFCLCYLVPGLLFLPAQVPAAEPIHPPNILLIISDDQGWADYGFMGHPHIQTPNLDRLAAQSLTFERGYSPVPLCRPSLASIITGLYPHQHGVTGNDPALPDPGVNPMAARGRPAYARYYDTVIEHFCRHPSLVRDLVGRGYLALETGKWWEGDPKKTARFTHAMTRGEIAGSRHGDTGLDIGRKGLDPIYRFLDEAGDQPWLIWYAPLLPHAPHTPPADLLQKYLKVAPSPPIAHYWASVEWFDRTCGELLDHLDQRGQRTNTLVVYTTDNGWLQDPTSTNRFAPRSKLTPYEGGTRTPIMVSWPGRVTPRRDSKHVASNVDLWPTIAALLRTPLPPELSGIDLTDPRAVAKRDRIFGEQYAHNIADVAAPTRSLEHRWLIEGWWKLIVPDPRALPNATLELYNLRNDPWEGTNLAGKETRRVSRLRQHLDTWWTPPTMFTSPWVWEDANGVPTWMRTRISDLLTNFRRPANDIDLRDWLENMVVFHRFTRGEVSAATGMTLNEVAAALRRFGLAGRTAPDRVPGHALRVLPYPGGRHPRLGFFDGAVMPQRETKVSVFAPWDDGGYVVVDVPEAIFSNLGLTYLAHTHIPTLWDQQGIALPRLEWNRRPDGALDSERTLPNGITFGAKVRPTPTEVRMDLWLRNRTPDTLTGLRVQNCVMLGYAPGFNAQTLTNQVYQPPYAAVRSSDGRRWIITALDPVQHCWGNAQCPCLHSDPQFPDCPPGETRRLRGWLSFYEGTQVEPEFQRIEATGWRK